MACSKPLTSSTIRQEQTAMVCELCEADPKLKWRCQECKMMMCQRCQDEVHCKFASAEDHTIIDIKDISKHQEEQKLDFTKLKCTEVKTHINDLVNDLDQKLKVTAESVDEEEEKVTGERETLLQQNDEVIYDRLNSNDVQRVFSAVSIETNINPVNTTFNRVPKFVPGDVRNIKTVYGKLEDTTIPYSKDIKVSQTFHTDVSIVSNMIICPDGSLWIIDGVLKVIQNVTPVEDKLKINFNLNLFLENFALTPSGDLLLCARLSSVIKVMPSGTEEIKDSPYNVSPLLPCGIHVTQDNKIIIGAIVEGQFYLATGPGQVIILDQSGQQEKIFKYDNHNQPLFTVPICITTSSNNNIGVVDWFSGGRGKVVILNIEGDVINIYKGHPDVNSEDKPLRPTDIKPTPFNNFIIADFWHHTLHILSSNGEMITYYNTEKLGILEPTSLSLNQAGQLFIGCDTQKDSDKKAKIYKLDNFVVNK